MFTLHVIVKMYQPRQLTLLISVIIILQNAWASAITELGGMTYLLVENQVKKEAANRIAIIIGEYICKQANRYWIRPGRSDTWWEHFLSNDVVNEEWNENFRMSRIFIYVSLR